MFQLEALKARHGDCLLLHWGEFETPRLGLIDGGPSGTYAQWLKPRLEELVAQKQNRVDLMMVSHIDDDHINGLLDFAGEVQSGDFAMTVDRVWFNSLEGLLDSPITEEVASTVTAGLQSHMQPSGPGWTPWSAKVLASVPQGQALDGLIKLLGLNTTRNLPFQPLILRKDGQSPANIRGLRLTPVAPSIDALETLRKVWIKKRKEDVTAAYKDSSPYNLSSIVVIAEFDGKSMLLTGDALGRDILDGLQDLGRLDPQGRAHFDLLKLPHHGSQNNVAPGFFTSITADHYVVSGDHIKFPNPHRDAMGWLADARGGDTYKVYCPYDLEYMREIFGHRLVTPADDTNSIIITLS